MTAGFFGKLPGNGDFVQRRLPRGFVDPWDRWLQRGVAASRTQMGAGWLDTYLNSPIWRFVLAAGPCGTQGWMGVLMPSVDKVGRYFPMTLAVPLAEGHGPAQGAWLGDAWFAQAETAALVALDRDVDLEKFDAAVAGLGEPLAPEGAAAYSPETPDAGPARAVCVTTPSADRLDMLFPNLLDALLGERFQGYSVWWTAGSQTIPPSMLACAAFPPPEGYAALLDGQYERWGWRAPAVETSGAASGGAPGDDPGPGADGAVETA